MSTFDTLFEQQIGRFVKSGPIAGDYIKIKPNCEASDWYKSQDKARQDYIQQIKTLSEQGKPLMLSTIKKEVYETAGTDSQAWNVADIVVETNPGFYTSPLTLPLELIEFDMTWEEARGTQKDPTMDLEDNSTLKPEPVEDKAIDVGQQTAIPGGDYKLGTANYMP